MEKEEHSVESSGNVDNSYLRCAEQVGYDDLVVRDREEYCEACKLPEHDICSNTYGCPCCEETMQHVGL